MLFKKIRSGNYSLESSGWSQISPPAKDLVSRMLTVEPSRRITAEQVFHHPWFSLDTKNVPSLKLTSALTQIKKLQARRRLKKAIDSVRVTVRMKLAIAAKNMRLARARGQDPSVAFFQGAQARGELRPQVERQMAAQQVIPDALVAGGRRTTTHRLAVNTRASEVTPSREALIRSQR